MPASTPKKHPLCPLQCHYHSTHGRSSWLTPSPTAVPTAYPSDPVSIDGCTRLRQPALVHTHIMAQREKKQQLSYTASGPRAFRNDYSHFKAPTRPHWQQRT